MKDALEEGLLPAGDLKQVAIATWTALHGITVIYLNDGYTALGLEGGPDRIITSMFAVYFPQLTSPWSQARLEREA